MRRAIHDRNVLFLCDDNAMLSQMAEATAKHLAPPKTRILSAGIKPGVIPEAVIKAMNEIGIAMTNHKCKGLAEVPMDEIDLVVSFGGAHKQCAHLPGRTKIESWPVSDKLANRAGQADDLDAMRGARDDIEKRVFALFMDYWRNIS